MWKASNFRFYNGAGQQLCHLSPMQGGKNRYGADKVGANNQRDHNHDADDNVCMKFFHFDKSLSSIHRKQLRER